MPLDVQKIPLSRIGEQTLIQKIKNWCAKSTRTPHSLPPYKTLVGLGDDAFVAKMSTNFPLVFSTDTLLEGTHFRLDWGKGLISQNNLLKALGNKAMAVNLSDLAAMGDVTPLFSFVTLGNNGDISVDSVDNIYKGMLESAREYRFGIVGGDIIRSEKSIISITIVGKLNTIPPIRRSGAKKGDILMATGPIGLSDLGLKILKNEVKLKYSYRKSLIFKHLIPEPKLAEGKILADEDILATSSIDTSDDLMTSLEILGRESGVGFRIDLDRIPLPSPLRDLPKGWNPYSFLLYGGEDYQLLFTIAPGRVQEARKRISESIVLGEVTDKKGKIEVYLKNRRSHAKETRFKHF